MIIAKNEKIYTVEDKGAYWSLKYSRSKLDVEFTIGKTLAGDFETLKSMILADEAF